MNVRFELDSFDIAAMALLGPAVRNCAQGLSGANEAAQRIVQLLDEVMKMPGSDEAALALARIYLTKTYGKLDATEAAFARNLAGCELHSDTVCLTLAGSAGRHENWCDPKKSRGHLAIPLLSVEEVLALPMVWRLFEQLGIDVEFLLSRKLVENSKLRESGLDVFHIEKAEGSRWVPGQDFVRDEAVQSCFAIGGVLPDGEVFSLLLFSKVAIDSKAATALRPLALNIEIALLPYLGFGRADEAEAKALAFGKLLTLKDSIVVRHVAALLEAREQAEAQNLLRQELLRNVRHELRTPMNGVLGTLGLLMESKTITGDDRHFAKVAYGSANGLMHVLENLVEYSDLITRGRESRSSAFDLMRLLEGLVEPLRMQSPSLEWRIEASEDCPRRIIADEAALAGVLRQFVENALKFTNRGRVEVKAELTAEGRMLSLSVTDTGIGIAEEHRAQIFEPFRQADGSTTRRFGGNGLGLAIVAELAKQLNASVAVESKLGEGACFRLELPLVRA